MILNRRSRKIFIGLICLLPGWAQADIFDANLEAAIAYDSNAYRSPGEDYTDFFADTDGNVIVTPEVQSGFYVPLNLDLSYDMKLSKKWRLIGDYSFDSRSYLDSALSNADQTAHKGALGIKYKILNFKKRKSSVYAGAIVGDRDRTYYDRDTGSEKTTGTGLDDVSDLYSYGTQGFEVSYDYWRKRAWGFDASYRVEDRDHATVPSGSEYDNEYTRLDLGVDYRLSKSFRIGLDYASYSYDYEFRHARNSSGQLFSSHPLLQYDYANVEIALKHRLSKMLSIKYSLETTQREDNYVGYNDYDQTGVAVTLRYRPNDKYLIRSKLALVEQEYPNAWNFDRDPSLYPAITDTTHKSAERSELDISVNYQYDKELAYFVEMDLAERSNSDPRYDYDRNQIAVGIKWKMN